MNKQPPNFKETVLSAQTTAIWQQVGRQKPFSMTTFSEGVADSERNCEAYRGGEALMPLHKFLKAGELLGPEFINPFLRLIGMDGARCVSASDGNPHAVNCELAEAIQLISAALRDGRITERERPKIIAALNELIEQAHSYVAALTNQQQEGK